MEQVREPVPLSWLVLLDPPELTTWGDYVTQCEAVIRRGNVDKEQIREWGKDL